MRSSCLTCGKSNSGFGNEATIGSTFQPVGGCCHRIHWLSRLTICRSISVSGQVANRVSRERSCAAASFACEAMRCSN